MKLGAPYLYYKKISSDARINLQEDTDLIMSLLLLKSKLISVDSANLNITFNRKDSPVKGFIQHIHASPFAVICFNNEAAVRLYHEVAKQTAVFCDATGTIVTLPKDEGGKVPSVYYYAIVLKHPVIDNHLLQLRNLSQLIILCYQSPTLLKHFVEQRVFCLDFCDYVSLSK